HVAIAGDHQHALGGLRQRQPQADADRRTHAAPQRHVERTVARFGDVPIGRAQPGDHQEIVGGALENLLHQRPALPGGLAHRAFLGPKSFMPISFWRSRTATAWPALKAARAAASTVGLTSSALSTE